MSDSLDYESKTIADPAHRPALWVIYLIVFADFVGFGIVIPLLPFYVPDSQEHPKTVAMLFSAYSICQFIGAPILGALSDRYGRRPVLIVSQWGSALGFVLLGLATDLKLAPWMMLTMVFISRVIDGFSGGNVSTAQAYISDVTTPATRAKAMGLMGAAFGIGFSVGPAIGGLVGHIDVSYPAYLAAFFAASAGILTMLLLPESRTHRPTGSANVFRRDVFMPVMRQPVVAPLIFISILSMFAFVLLEPTIALFLEATFGWRQREVGWYTAMIGFVIMLVQGGLVGRLTSRFGEWALAITGPVLTSVAMLGFVLVGWMPLLWLLIVVGIINATGRSLQMPVVSALISQHASADRQGVTFGVYHSLTSMSRVFGPIVAGTMYALHHTAQYMLGSVLLAMAAVWTFQLALKYRRPERKLAISQQEARAKLAEAETAHLGEV